MREVFRSHRGILGVVTIAILIAACASLAPGADPVIVNTERVLIVAPSLYDTGMTFAEQNKAVLSAGTLAVFEKIRLNFPPAYRAADAALQGYKAGTNKDGVSVLALSAAVEQFVSQLSALLVANGGPQIWPVPTRGAIRRPPEMLFARHRVLLAIGGAL